MNSVLTHINEYGNPFEDEDCPELLVLHTRECAADEVQASMKKIEALGKNQYNKFTKEVFEKRSLSIDETIKKNSLPMFANSSRKKKSSTAKIKALRHDVSVFGRLYISNQYRDGDPDVFFAHENQPYTHRHLLTSMKCALGQNRICLNFYKIQLSTSNVKKIETVRSSMVEL